MQKVFNKLPFPAKLMALGIIPLLFLIYFAIQIIHEKENRVKIVRDVISNINNSILVSKLGSELHLERRKSFSYITDKASSPEVLIQFNKTDAAIDAIRISSGEAFADYFEYSMLNELKRNRKFILRKQFSDEQALNYYSTVIGRVHSFYNTSVENIPYLKSASKDLAGQRIMFNLANSLGIARAKVYIVSTRKDSLIHQYNEIQNQIDLINSFLKEFNVKASETGIRSVNQLNKSNEAIYTTEIFRQIELNSRLPEKFNSEEWWTTTGTLIDNIISIQSNQIESTKTETEEILENENLSLYLSIGLLAIILILVILLIIYTIHNITDILDKLRVSAEKIALGETSAQIDLVANDVIGALAKSIKVIDINNNQLARAADSIGKGDFNIILNPRSENDILGMAVLRMKEDLHEFRKENAEKLWIQAGLSIINDTVRGEKPVDTLCRDVLDALVSFLDAKVGMIYKREDNLLHFSAGYALPQEYVVSKTIKFGETLLGESAKKKNILLLDGIPEDSLKISTASTELYPKHVIIIPLLHNSFVEGVIEIGSLNPFSSSVKRMLEEWANIVAVAIHTAKNRTKLQELLEETQAQSEELQAQHSELEGLNTELEAQAQKLQASEEELRVQQEELLQSNKELEEKGKSLEEKNQLIVERNLDIQRKAEELEISTKYKSEFLANMSHELRTPLNSILLLSRLMYENTEQNLTEEQVEYARVIQSSGNGLLLLIDEILDLSKIESGKMDFEYADVAVKDIADDMRSLFAPIAKEKSLHFDVSIQDEVLIKIATDKMRVEQVLKNLLSNALKFTSKGSVSLQISSTDKPGYIDLSVEDSGIGIHKDKHQQIFEAFQQADGSTQRKFGGTGLGLSISRELAKLLGGEIFLVSEEGKGSKFTFRLPMQKMEKSESLSPIEFINPPAPLKHVEVNPKLANRHVVYPIPHDVEDDRDQISGIDKVILIIEDDTNFAKSLLSFTRKSGYKGLVAVRGDTGIEMAAMYNPLAILLDIQLPVKDGWEVMEELKANAKTRHIPVHIMSSLEVKKESLIKGAVDFINKPVALEQIQQMFSKLEQVLEKHPKKVLIIEENSKHARALSYYLETFSVSSEIKGSVSEGIDSLLSNSVECVILDMGIPDQNAYETLDQIKKNPGLENLPIIIFTGKNLSKAEEGRLKHYADSIVMKTAHSYQRILDEVALFLHIVEEKKSSKNTLSEKPAVLLELNEVLSGKKVLIADDDVRNIFSLTKALEQLKMNVISATDGKEALKILESNPDTDIVLMDMMMPEMDGYESTRKIRNNPQFRNLPVLAVTAKAMLGDREKCIQAGASDYISKPVDIDQLISLLRVWLYYKNV